MSKLITNSVRVLTLGFFVFLFGFGWTSCSKDTKCKGDVYVIYNATKLPVVGASVTVAYGVKTYSGLSDGSGKFHVELDLPAILTVTVTGPTGGTGSGTLKFEPGTTNSVTIGI